MPRILQIFLILAATVSTTLFIWIRSDDDSANLSERIKELEESKLKDLERQKELEREFASHKLAMEWEAIERERQEIEARRAELQGSENSDQELDGLKMRSEDLAKREALAEEKQGKLGEDIVFPPGGRKLPKGADLPFAGLEAGAFAETFDSSVATVDYEYFDDALSPYGTWYDTEDYGSVWQPAVCHEADWRPYTRGQWVCSDRGWTWVSSEPFGWATYHYGRWALLQDRGWIWVPGTEWAPNWCTWRSNDLYIGWAPLPPETLAYQNHNWDSRVERRHNIGARCFSFVRVRHFDHHISRHCLPANLNPTCLKTTNNITRIQVHKGQIFCGGPGYHELSKRLDRQLPFYQIHRHRNSYERHNPAHLRSRIKGDRLVVAAPRVQKTGTIFTSQQLGGVKAKRNTTINTQVPATFSKIQPRVIAPRTSTKGNPISTQAIKPATPRPLSVAARPERTIRSTAPRATSTPAPEAEKRKAEARLEAFRKMAREQRAIASAEKARQRQREIAAAEEQEKLASQQRKAEKAQLLVAAQHALQEATQRRSEEQAEQKQREEQDRQRSQEDQRRQEEMARQRQEEDAQRRAREDQQRIAEQQRQQLEQQRRAREEAQRQQRAEQDRQRAAEQRRAREEAQRRSQEEARQRQQRDEALRRSQEQAQRQQRDEQQRQQRSQRSK